MSLLLQRERVVRGRQRVVAEVAARGVPSALAGGAARLPWSANDGCSGQAPVSRTPTMTPCAGVGCRRRGRGYRSSAPMNSGLESVSGWSQLVLLHGDDAGDREQRRRSRSPARSARRRRRRCAATARPARVRHRVGERLTRRTLLVGDVARRSACTAGDAAARSWPVTAGLVAARPGHRRVGGDRVVVELDDDLDRRRVGATEQRRVGLGRAARDRLGRRRAGSVGVSDVRRQRRPAGGAWAVRRWRRLAPSS